MVDIPVQVADPRLVQARRRQIVEAARGVFRQKGFHNTTVRDIGRAAGLTQGTLYNYIGSKEDILFLVLDQVVCDHRQELEAAYNRETDPEQRLRAVVRASVETTIRHEDDLLFLYQESHSLPSPALRKLLGDVRSGVELVITMLRETLDPAELATINLDLVGNIVNFLPAIACLRRWDLRGRCAPEELVDGLTDFILRGLGHDGAAGHDPAAAPTGNARHPASGATCASHVPGATRASQASGATCASHVPGDKSPG